MNQFNSDVLGRLAVAVAVVNALRQGALASRPRAVFEDNGYQAPTTGADWAAVDELAGDLATLLDLIAARHDTCAINAVNERLRSLPVTPQIEQREGKLSLHFHPLEASFADGWAAGIAAALAIAYSTNEADRIGKCSASDCPNHFLDRGRNKQRRFCSLQCQNRAKSAAYRGRRVEG